MGSNRMVTFEINNNNAVNFLQGYVSNNNKRKAQDFENWSSWYDSLKKAGINAS